MKTVNLIGSLWFSEIIRKQCIDHFLYRGNTGCCKCLLTRVVCIRRKRQKGQQAEKGSIGGVMQENFEIRCLRDKFEQYRKHLTEIIKLENSIDKLLKKQEHLAIVKDKVQASLNDWPYTLTHVTVDAYDPLKYTTIERMIRKKQMLIEAYNKEILEVENIIDSMEDSITRIVFREVYIEGRKQKDVAEELNYTPARISQIIQKELNREISSKI